MGGVADIPGLGKATDKPQPVAFTPSADRALTPIEGFVLSRVDGHTSFAELCRISGLGAQPTIDVLVRLKTWGLIRVPGQTASRAVKVATAPQPKPAAAGSFLERLDDGSAVDGVWLQQQAPGLDAVTAARIVRLHRRLGTLRPEDLLGVDSHAPLAVAKKAYFAASKELHPDRYYGREIGPLRDLLAEIFAACTRAFDAFQRQSPSTT